MCYLLQISKTNLVKLADAAYVQIYRKMLFLNYKKKP